MTRWANSLVRISNHEVETLQKRLADIVGRRMGVERLIAALDDELAFELANKQPFEEAGFYLAGFREGATTRRNRFQAQLIEIAQEEAGARDALTEAFETLKKYEHVVEAAKAAAAKEELKRETATLDELGLRKLAR